MIYPSRVLLIMLGPIAYAETQLVSGCLRIGLDPVTLPTLCLQSLPDSLPY